MSQDPVATESSNRRASRRDQRLQQLDALAAFANLGEKPQDWQRFRTMYPHFFPEGITEQLYKGPQLLWYRDRLRAVWTRNDPKGANLSILYGLEKLRYSESEDDMEFEDGELARENEKRILELKKDPTSSWNWGEAFADIPGPQTLFSGGRPIPTEPIGDLPIGLPRVNGVTGKIDWWFQCDLQRFVWELMKTPWRAKVCPNCGKFFVADKSATKLCSPRCFGEVKRQRALDYWHEEGSARRDERLKKLKKASSQRKGKAK